MDYLVLFLKKPKRTYYDILPEWFGKRSSEQITHEDKEDDPQDPKIRPIHFARRFHTSKKVPNSVPKGHKQPRPHTHSRKRQFKEVIGGGVEEAERKALCAFEDATWVD